MPPQPSLTPTSSPGCRSPPCPGSPGRVSPHAQGMGCGGPRAGPGGVQGRKGAPAGPQQRHGKTPSHCMAHHGAAALLWGGVPKPRTSATSVGQGTAPCLLPPPCPQPWHKCSPKALCSARTGTPELKAMSRGRERFCIQISALLILLGSGHPSACPRGGRGTALHPKCSWPH